MNDDAKKRFRDIIASALSGIDNPFGGMPGATTTVTYVAICKACKQKNRVNVSRQKPRCGKCGLPL